MSGAELIPCSSLSRLLFNSPVQRKRHLHTKTVSFDGAYLGVPLPKEEVEDENAPWPHTDQ